MKLPLLFLFASLATACAAQSPISTDEMASAYFHAHLPVPHEFAASDAKVAHYYTQQMCGHFYASGAFMGIECYGGDTLIAGACSGSESVAIQESARSNAAGWHCYGSWPTSSTIGRDFCAEVLCRE